jgi:hypothetical protein
MTEVLTRIGFSLTTPMGIFWVCTAWTFLIVTAIWIIGNFQTDALGRPLIVRIAQKLEGLR